MSNAELPETENGNPFLVSVAKKAVGDMQKGRISTMMLAISRLFKFKKVVVGNTLN